MQVALGLGKLCAEGLGKVELVGRPHLGQKRTVSKFKSLSTECNKVV